MKVGNFVTPNEKGQIVIPYKIRRDLGIDENTLLQVMASGQSITIYPISDVVRKWGYGATFRDILTRTAGAWGPVSQEEKKWARKRRQIELQAAKRRRQAW